MAKPRITKAEAEIDHELHREITRDAFARVVDRARGRADAAMTDEANQTSAQIFAFEEHEDDEQQHQTRNP